MPAELWWMIAVVAFYLGMQACLGRSSQHDLDQASMLPFADDPEVACRIERELGLSISGCACQGPCDGTCKLNRPSSCRDQMTASRKPGTIK